MTSSSEEKLGGPFSIACPLLVVLGPRLHRCGPAKLDFRTWRQSAAASGQPPELQRCPVVQKRASWVPICRDGGTHQPVLPA